MNQIFGFCRRGGTQNSQMSTEEDVDEPIDPNEPRYCICNQVAYGTMVACDNKGVIIKINIVISILNTHLLLFRFDE